MEDSNSLLIIMIAIAVVIAIIIAILIFTSQGSKENNGDSEEKNNDFSNNNSFANDDGSTVTDERDLQSRMQAEETELLTKYTAGNLDGIYEVETLLERDPNNVDLLDWLAFMYYSNGNIDKAIETYKRSLANKPDNENQHYYLGNSYYKKNMFAEAKKCWSEVIRLKPASKIARNAQERIDYLKSKGK